MIPIEPSTADPEQRWKRIRLLSYAFAALSLPIWLIPVSSRWLIPFALAGAAALVVGAISLYALRYRGGTLLERLSVIPAPLAGALAVMKLEYWWEKFS
ncbi:MAG: hypothetical protein IT452_20130 [Planctomycetia bacterium]|nr:hypothetical protein [Planctomycetia bacterium]